MTSTATAPAWATHWTRRALEALPADHTTATPPQVDEVIRTVQLDQARTAEDARRAVDAVRRAIGWQHRTERTSRTETREYWVNSDGAEVDMHAAEKIARTLDPNAPAQGYYDHRLPMRPTVGDALAEVDRVRATYAEQVDIETAMHTEYDRRGGWTRYHRVANSNGHVHTSTACRTTLVTTAFNWPTALSGADDAEVVAAAGALTCLVCFSSVREDIVANRPTDDRRFETPELRDAREQREREAKERKDKKMVKAITPDGKPLRVKLGHFHEEIGTARGAEIAYVKWAAEAEWARVKANEVGAIEGEQAAERAAYWRIEHANHATAAEVVLVALAWKHHGNDLEAARAHYQPKVDKKLAARRKLGY